MNVKSTAAILALSMLPGVSHAGLLDSALRFWSFDGTLSDSVANIGATGRNWTSGFSTDRDGNLGGALDLTGNLDAIVVDPSALNPDEYSLSVWFSMTSHNLSGGRSQLFDTRGLDNVERASLIGFIDAPPANDDQANGLLGTFRGDAQGIELSGANNQSWHHLLFTVSNTEQTIYYNGNTAPVSAVAPYGSFSTNDWGSGLVFGDKGADIGNLGFNFNGSLDDIALWDRALSASDAAALFAAPASASGVPAPATFLLLLSGIGLLRARKRG